MKHYQPVDVTTSVIDVFRDLTMAVRDRMPGAPRRIDGMTIGIVAVDSEPPHLGEVHPDGDEFLYVMSGRLSLHCESTPTQAFEIGPGQGCIVRRSEWHRLKVVEPATLLHVTPGPNGDHRPLTREPSP